MPALQRVRSFKSLRSAPQSGLSTLDATGAGARWRKPTCAVCGPLDRAVELHFRSPKRDQRIKWEADGGKTFFTNSLTFRRGKKLDEFARPRKGRVG